METINEKNMLQSHVDSIAKNLECGLTYDECGMTPECDSLKGSDQISGFEYLEDCLDIQWIIDGDKDFIGARVLVAFGGPNIWVDTLRCTVDGHWWGDSYSCNYNFDAMQIEEALRELWECTK
jgi:hypothetical protein